LTFVNEPKLFSIGTISLSLKPRSSFVINIIHIERTINTVDSSADIKVNHEVVFEILVNKISKVALQSKDIGLQIQRRWKISFFSHVGVLKATFCGL
jgi:hypothetical protein